MTLYPFEKSLNRNLTSWYIWHFNLFTTEVCTLKTCFNIYSTNSIGHPGDHACLNFCFHLSVFVLICLYICLYVFVYILSTFIQPTTCGLPADHACLNSIKFSQIHISRQLGGPQTFSKCNTSHNLNENSGQLPIWEIMFITEIQMCLEFSDSFICQLCSHISMVHFVRTSSLLLGGNLNCRLAIRVDKRNVHLRRFAPIARFKQGSLFPRHLNWAQLEGWEEVLELEERSNFFLERRKNGRKNGFSGFKISSWTSIKLKALQVAGWEITTRIQASLHGRKILFQGEKRKTAGLRCI